MQDVQQQDGSQFAVSPRFAALHSPRLAGQSYLSPTQDIRQLDPQHRMELELHSSLDPTRASLNHAISPRAGYDFWHTSSNVSSPALASHPYSSSYAPSSHVSSSTLQQPAHPNQSARRSPSPLAPLLPASAPLHHDSQPNTTARERSVPINHFVANATANAINSPPSTSLLPPSQLHPQLQQPQQPHQIQQHQAQQQQFPLSFPNAGAASSISQQQLAMYQQQLQLNQQQQQQLAHEHQLKLEQAHNAVLAAASDGGQKQATAAAASAISSPMAFHDQQPSQVQRQRSGNAALASPNVAMQQHPPPPFMPMELDPLLLQRQLHEQMLFQEKLLKQQQNLLALKRQHEQLQQHLLVQSPIGASLPQTQPFVAAATGSDPRSPQTWQQQQPQHYQHPQTLPAAALPPNALATNAIVIPPLVRRSSSLFDHSPSPVAAVVPAVAVGGSSKYTPSPPPPPIGPLLASSNSPRASPGVSAGGMGHIGNLQGLASTPKETKVAAIICGTAPPTDVTSPPAPMMDVSSSAPNSGGGAARESVSPTRSTPRDDDLQTATSRRARIAHMTKAAPVRFSRIGRAIVKTDLSSPEPPSSTHTQARSVSTKREPRPPVKRARKNKPADSESDEDEEREERKASATSDEEANSDDSESESEEDDDDETSEADEKPRRKAKAARKSSPVARTPARKPVAGKKKDSASSPRPSTPPVKLNANGKPKREKGSSCHQCKTRRIDAIDLHHCGMTHPRRPAPPGARQRKRKKERVCRKKYCTRCLERFYGEEAPPKPAPGEPNTFACPGCRGLCTCAACKRGFSKKEEQDAAQPTAAAAAPASAAPVKNGHQKSTASSAASSAASTPASQRSRPMLAVQAKALPVDKNRPLVASPVTPQSSAVAVVKKHAPVDRGAHAKRMHQAAMAVLERKRAEPHAASSTTTTAAESEGPTRRSPRNVTRRMSVADRARDHNDPDDDSQNALSETSLPVTDLDGLRSASPVASAHRSILGLSSPLRTVRRGARRDSIPAVSHARSDTPDGEMLSLSPAKQYSTLRGILSPRHGLSSHGLPDLGSHGFAAMGMSPAESGGYRSLEGDESGGSASATTSTYTGAMSGTNSPMMHGHARRSSRASLMSGGGIGSNSGMMRSRRIDSSNHFGEADGVMMTDTAAIKHADLPELL